MRVLIAEDELLERKAMCKFIENHFPDLQIVGEAVNGRDAIELAHCTKPDIIFMDISMPGINGLEAIETIIKDDHHVKFILVSAYDSFAFAKQAMQFGIKEYILKPGKKVEIIRAIRRVQKEIEAEWQQAEEKLVSSQLVKEHLLTKLMNYPIDEATKRIHQQYFPHMNNGYFLVVQVPPAIAEQGVYQAFERYLPSTFIAESREEFYIVCVFAVSETTNKNILQIAKNLHMQLGPDSVVGVSHPLNIHDLPRAYHEAFTACYELGKAGGRAYGFFDQQLGEQPDVITSLTGLLERGQAEDAIWLFRNHMQEAGSEKMDDLYMQIKTVMDERHLSMPGQRLTDLSTIKDWENWIMLCCLKMKEYHQSKQYIEKAKQFMKEHYVRAISLEETAANVNLSPNYFSNLFKQEFGITFIDYLTRIRLQKAKELLEENHYSLKEISAMVGYNDPNYFSRVFKKHFSESPRHFQQTIVKK